MADNSGRINFIKTFIHTAGVMMKVLQIEKGRDMWYWRSAKDVARLYPALKLAAAELNRNCGFHVSIPEDNPKRAFPAAEAFYHLYREIEAQSGQNENFARARVLFNPEEDDFVRKAGDVSRWVAQEGNEFDRYWLNRSMVLAAAYTGEMQDEIFSGVLDEFLETQLAERMMSTVIRRGGIINSSDVEGVRSVLAGAAEDFSKMPGFVSEKKVAAEMTKRLQRECSWDARSEPVRKTVAEFTDQFTRIVAKNRAEFYRYYRNNDTARGIAADFDNSMSDEAYFKLERARRFNERLGIREADIRLPAGYDLTKIFTEINSFDSFSGETLLFRPGSPEEYWDNYENSENISENLTEDMENVISYLIKTADQNLPETGALLDRLEDDGHDEDVDDDEFSDLRLPTNSYDANMSENIEQKQAILAFAGDILDIAEVVKKYYDIELNDTPVDWKVIREFKADGSWNDFTFSSLRMLFNAFDRNLETNQEILLSDEGIRLEAVDELAVLPKNLEKRNVLKLFDMGLCKLEAGAVVNQNRLEADAAEDFSIYHQDDYRKLISELRWGQEVFGSLTDEVVDRLAVDINAAAVVNYVIPVYDDTFPDVSAPRKMLNEIGDYGSQPLEVQKYIEGLAGRHVSRILKTHHQVLDEGDFDRDLFKDVEELVQGRQRIKDIAVAKRKTEKALAEEEGLYQRYRAFRKTHPDRMQILMARQWQMRICNN